MIYDRWWLAYTFKYETSANALNAEKRGVYGSRNNWLQLISLIYKKELSSASHPISSFSYY